jgi:indolepyruvate ferredoxin oxidoreductase alpha subunit
MSSQRPVAVMGDGGFWHNGLLSGVASNLLNKGDGVLVIMKNGYASATGTQELSPRRPRTRAWCGRRSSVHADRTIEDTLTGLGVKWLRTVNNYKVGEVAKVYKEAMTTKEKGLKVIVAEGECQLERQRRLKPQVAKDFGRARHVA